MLHIDNLHVQAGDTPILKGLNLNVSGGSLHVIMGPNGGGKSTLAQAICGNPALTVSGTLEWKGQDTLSLSPTQRALAGIFLAFQNPVEIPGLSVATFIKSAIDAQRKYRQEPPIDAYDFLEKAKAACAQLDIDPSMLKRGVHEGLSGGERKRIEMLQLMLLQPQLAILDETDSGLDVDALKRIYQMIPTLRTSQNAFVVITHYHKILEYITPDTVHVMMDGRIVASGDSSLSHTIEQKGYEWLLQK